MASATPQGARRPRSKRPAMISELAERARDHNWDENGSMKYYLRLAEKDRRDGVTFANNKDLENSFVTFARAASLILEKIPSHRDYSTALNAAQRSNLAMNGQEILDNLGQLKPTLLLRYEKWAKAHPDGEESDDQTPPQRQAVQLENSMDRMNLDDMVKTNQEQHRRINEELELWQKQREGYYPRPELPEPPNSSKARHDATINAARQAAGIHAERDRRRDPYEPDDRARDHYSRQQEAERNGQQERQRAAAGNGVSHTTPSGIQMPTASIPAPMSIPSAPYAYGNPALRAPMASHSRPPSFIDQYHPNDGPAPMPLESPTRFDEDSTDTEAASNRHKDWRKNARQRHGVESLASARPVVRNASYPPPMTTTSPPPSEGYPIQYPQLMSKHQRSQGYAPSLNSMFSQEHGPSMVPSSLLFDANQQGQQQQLYPPSLLPRPSSMPQPSINSQPISYPSHPAPRPQPPIPPPPNIPPQPDRVTRPSASAATPSTGPDLKQVNMPRDCLPRFLAIAKVNTTMNLETCGLLLGKAKGSKYVVTTLLVPRQHATSDTCTMDQEELVLQFTEERNLITLGWIHTHPSQSCFMSSVDLHTHSGFQCMLAESFAVVCAPKSTPNFGIFRLTDPPGLQTILNCTAGDAFHPHPDVPIYTDADKGHVQMKDIPLEIVDLR